MDFGLGLKKKRTSPNERMTLGLGLDVALSSSTSCELSSSSATTSESEDVVPTNDKSTTSNSSSFSSSPPVNTRKSFSHTSLADFRSLPHLKDRLGEIWERKIHCDVLFHVSPTKDIVTAHRIILASASHIFDRLFYENEHNIGPPHNKKYHHHHQHQQLIVHEPDYSTVAFQHFIKALYTNECPEDLPLSLALEIFYASKKYHVTFLEDQILSYILTTVSVDNVFEALKVSTSSIELTNMVPICWKIIEEDTSKVLQAHLEELDSLNFTRILTRDHLNIEEVELFQFLVKWGSIQCKKRGVKTTGKNKRQLIDHLLKYIRFSTMHPMDFNDIVIPSRILEPKEIFTLQSSHHHHHNISPTNNNHCQGDSSFKVIRLPYNSRPRFKPNHGKPRTATTTILRRPESLTNNAQLFSAINNNHQKPAATASDIQLVGKHNSRKLRPKKSSRKLNISKPTNNNNGSRTCR